MSVGQLAETLGGSIPIVSHHLQILHAAHLVERTRKGRFTFYALPPGVFQPADSPHGKVHVDLGCCRLEFSSE